MSRLTGHRLFVPALGVLLVVLAALLPRLNLSLPGVLPGPTYTPGSLQVLAYGFLIASLPAVLRIPLSEPIFILGSIFVLIVMFLPGGIAGIAQRVRGSGESTHAH